MSKFWSTLSLSLILTNVALASFLEDISKEVAQMHTEMSSETLSTEDRIFLSGKCEGMSICLEIYFESLWKQIGK